MLFVRAPFLADLEFSLCVIDYIPGAVNGHLCSSWGKISGCGTSLWAFRPKAEGVGIYSSINTEIEQG